MLSWIEINENALAGNLGAFSRLLPGKIIAPVLKANAYGHGLSNAYQAIAKTAKWIGVNYLKEAGELRQLGFQGRILIVGPVTADGLKEASQLACDIFVGSPETLAAACQQKPTAKIHLEFDTGMSRQGFRPEEAATIRQKTETSGVEIAGLCMHFANVEDVTEHDYARLQLQRFEGACQAFKSYPKPLIRHAASSASALLLPESHFDLERVGISLYGLWPSAATRLSYLQLKGQMLDLKPALAWRTHITSVIDVEAGQYIGYGCTFRARHPMKIAVLPVGYYEGYPRVAAAAQSYTLVGGERCPIVGRICMNMLMIDVTGVEKAKVGAVATLIGTDGAETIHAGDLASWAGTIHYEIITRLHPDIPRRSF